MDGVGPLFYVVLIQLFHIVVKVILSSIKR